MGTIQAISILILALLVGIGSALIVGKPKPRRVEQKTEQWLDGYYRRARAPMPRYSIRVDGELLEADSFAGIIRQMRERGYPEDDIIAAALASLHEPRGGELQRGQR
jgi:hypothetical protein